MAEENSRERNQKEFSLGELLSATWRLFSKNLKLVLTAVLVVAVPLRFISTYLANRQAEKIGIDFFTNPASAFDNFGSLFGQAMLMSLIYAVGVALISLMIAWIVKIKVEDGQIDFSTVWQKALSRWPQAIFTSLIMGIMLSVLFMLLVIPGVIFIIFWAFAIHAIILNDKSGMDALNYSKSIVAGKWGTVFFYFLVIGILLAIVSSIINRIIGFGGSNFVISFFQGVVGDITNSFFTIASVLLFLNLESLKFKQINNRQNQ